MKMKMLGNCYYCGIELTQGLPKYQFPTSRTRDHVIPRSKGGIETIYCCAHCNTSKRNDSLEDFRARLRKGHGRWNGIFWGEMTDMDRGGIVMFFAPSTNYWRKSKNVKKEKEIICKEILSTM